MAADTTLGVSGSIGGTGDLVKTGTGTLHLAGNNAYGDTIVREGGLIGNSESISVNIVNDGEVAFFQEEDGSLAGDIAGSGTMGKFGFGTLTLDWTIDAGGLVSASDRFAGDVTIGVRASLIFDQASSGTYAGVLSGSGSFTKDGSGEVLLTGSGFLGTTNVSAGALRVGQGEGNGALGGDLNVQSGATLGGSGTVGSGAGSVVAVASGGTLSRGNSMACSPSMAISSWRLDRALPSRLIRRERIAIWCIPRWMAARWRISARAVPMI